MVDDVVPVGAPIVIPNAEFLSKEELRRAKHNEKMRRYKQRKRKGEAVAKRTNQGLRKLKNNELVELSSDARDIALQTLNKKLVQLHDDDEALGKANLVQLATTFAILVDKSNLMQGLATEHIAIKAKIDINMNADQAMDELNKMREQTAEGHE